MTHPIRSFTSICLTLMITFPIGASAVVDVDAAVVLLRKDCGTLDNCFESITDLTTTGTTGWIWQTRNPAPSAAAPLLVDVGPGVFEGTFYCDGTGLDRGYVTLRGSGREQSIVKGAIHGALIEDCRNLSFIDIGFHGVHYGVGWTGAQGGFSSWSNVDVVGLGTAPTGVSIGWYDSSCAGQTTRSVHYFHGSRIRAISGGSWNIGFLSRCAENWIFGGEISLELIDGSSSNIFPRVIDVGGGLVEVFGTAIRGMVGGTYTSTFKELVGVWAWDDQQHSLLPKAFHSHGVNIGLSTVNHPEQTDIDVIGIKAQGNVMVHSPGTAYNLSPGDDATAIRLKIVSGTPHVMAPFHWAADTSPPDVTTLKGEDLFVETDCANTGCSSTGTEPHLLVSNPTCSSGWWDVGLKACR